MGIVVTVKDVMTKDIVSVEKTELVLKAVERMVKKEIGSVVVTDKGKPVGILTERDILKRVCQQAQTLCTKITAGEIMSQPLITIDSNARLGEAALLMVQKGVRRLLVVEKGKTVGIITQKDVMRATIETFMALSMIQ